MTWSASEGVDRVDLRLAPSALTSWAVTAAGIVWPVGRLLAIGCLVVGAASALARRRAPPEGTTARAVSTALLAVSVVGAGFGLAVGLRADAVRNHPITAGFGSSAEVTAVPVETPRAVGTGRLMFRADLRRIGDGEMRGRVVVFAPMLGYSQLGAGQPVRFRAGIGRPTRRDLSVAVLTATGEPVLGRASLAQRIAADVRERFATRAREALPAAQAAMLPALVLGDTSTVAPATSAEFRAAGLTHLTAVSGANVTIVCGAVLFLGRLVGPRAAVALATAALLAFVVVVQPSASVLRAAVMGAITLLAILTARRRQAMPALSATVIALMIAAPHLAVDVGFALSVSATAALVLLAPRWSQRLSVRGWPKPVADAVCIAAAAQLVTAPLIAGVTGTLSLVSVAANLAVAPLIAPITVLGTAAATLCPFWPAAARLLIRFTGPELWWLLNVAHRAAGLPNATLPVPSGVGGVLLVALAGAGGAALWRWRWFRVGVGGATVCLIAWSVSALAAPGVVAGL